MYFCSQGNTTCNFYRTLSVSALTPRGSNTADGQLLNHLWYSLFYDVKPVYGFYSVYWVLQLRKKKPSKIHKPSPSPRFEAGSSGQGFRFARAIRAGRLHYLMTLYQYRWRLHIARSRSQVLRLAPSMGQYRPPSSSAQWAVRLAANQRLHIMRTGDFQEEQLPASFTYTRNEKNSVGR